MGECGMRHPRAELFVSSTVSQVSGLAPGQLRLGAICLSTGAHSPERTPFLCIQRSCMRASEWKTERGKRESRRMRANIWKRKIMCVCFRPPLLLYRQLPTPGNPGMTQLPSGIQMQAYRFVPSGFFFCLPARSLIWVSVSAYVS